MYRIEADAAIIGGGLGGVAAAIALLESGYKVVLTEEYAWLGGQATSQGVPPDEHRYIEDYGTDSYLAWRNRIRDYYLRNYPLTKEAKRQARLNPGGGFVSALCHEPRIGALAIDEMLAKYVSFGQLKVIRNAKPIAAETEGRAVKSVTVRTAEAEFFIEAPFVLDASELGDLLPLTGTEYVTGSESKEDTGEDHAVDVADPLDMQSITWCFAMSRGKEGENHVIPKPERYEHYKQHLSEFWPDSQLAWEYIHPITLEAVPAHIEPTDGERDMWNYRKILTRSHYPADSDLEEITLVNWPHNDYWFGNIIEEDEETIEFHLNESREISLCWFYWLQTEAPRPDGGYGYPELKLRGDVLGTDDGLAMAPYIREARRIKPLYRVTEGDVGYQMRKRMLDEGKITELTAASYDDTVGVGFYRIDLHPSTGGRNYIDILSLPFEIPLGALIPADRDNLLAANKNIGTTHITNGCYRLHPVEWNIGESCGHLVAYCLEHNLLPAEVRENEMHLKSYQETLQGSGIRLRWNEELRRGWIPIDEPGER